MYSIAATYGAKQAQWLEMLMEYNYKMNVKQAMEFRVDNKSAINLTKK